MSAGAVEVLAAVLAETREERDQARRERRAAQEQVAAMEAVHRSYGRAGTEAAGGRGTDEGGDGAGEALRRLARCGEGQTLEDRIRQLVEEAEVALEDRVGALRTGHEQALAALEELRAGQGRRMEEAAAKAEQCLEGGQGVDQGTRKLLEEVVALLRVEEGGTEPGADGTGSGEPQGLAGRLGKAAGMLGGLGPLGPGLEPIRVEVLGLLERAGAGKEPAEDAKLEQWRSSAVEGLQKLKPLGGTVEATRQRVLALLGAGEDRKDQGGG